MKAFLTLLVVCFASAGAAFAHETTRSYLTLTRDGAELTATLRVAFRDIEVAVWIDENLDGQITWAETVLRTDAISDYATMALVLSAGGPCTMTRIDEGASQLGGLAYLDLTFRARCPDPQAELRLKSRLFAEIDPDHRLFLTANLGASSTTALLGAADNSVRLSGATGGAAGAFLSYFKEGVRHLLEGADHLVFLLVLVVPAAVARTGTRKAAFGVLAAVTGFTLAHAMTLTAAATEVLRPPTVVIELLIAVSIVITALDNLRPFIGVPRAAVATFFGLIHGFGFATALSGLQLSGFGFATALVAFNLGIEVAQIGVILGLLPALIFLGHGQVVLRIASLGAAIAGIYWVILRLPF